LRAATRAIAADLTHVLDDAVDHGAFSEDDLVPCNAAGKAAMTTRGFQRSIAYCAEAAASTLPQPPCTNTALCAVNHSP